MVEKAWVRHGLEEEEEEREAEKGTQMEGIIARSPSSIFDA
jgi:hypothetical protein